MTDHFSPAELRKVANGKTFRFGCYSMRPDYTPVICPYCRMDDESREFNFCKFSWDGCHLQAQRIDNLERCPLIEAAECHQRSLRDPDRGIMDYDEHRPLADLITQGIIEDPGRVEIGRV